MTGFSGRHPRSCGEGVANNSFVLHALGTPLKVQGIDLANPVTKGYKLGTGKPWSLR